MRATRLAEISSIHPRDILRMLACFLQAKEKSAPVIPARRQNACCAVPGGNERSGFFYERRRAATVVHSHGQGHAIIAQSTSMLA